MPRWEGPVMSTLGCPSGWGRPLGRLFSRGTQLSARLMAQVFPDHELTRAALWYTAQERAKDNELRWFVRVDRDRGQGTTVAEMESKLRRLCKMAEPSEIRIFAVIGRAGSKHSKFARKLASRLGTEPLSFGALLRKRWEASKPGQPVQRDLQQLGSRFLEENGPFALCRELLNYIPVERSEYVVIDGVRHLSVKDALQFIFEDRVKFVGVDADASRINSELRRRSDELSVVLIVKDSTELEVPALIEQSDERVPSPWTEADEDRVLAVM